MSIGDTFNCQISSAATMGINAVFHVSFAAFDILHSGATMSATTAGRIPLNIRSTTGLSAKDVKQMAMVSMIRKDGSALPSAHVILPLTPFSLYPTNIDVLIAITPGAD